MNLAFLSAVVLSLFLPLIGNAEAIEAPRPVSIQTQDFERVYLYDQAQILKDEKRTLRIQDVLLKSQDFSPNTFGRRNLPTDDIYWQRFRIQNDSAQPVQAVLSHEYPIIKHLDIYRTESGEPRLVASKTDPKAISNKALVFRNFSVKVNLDPGLNEFYVRTENRMAPQSINFALYNPDDFSKMMLLDSAIIFGLLGIVGFSILYNFFIYLQLRHAYYIPFILFTVFMCLGQLADRGFFHSTFKFDLFKNNDAFLIAFSTAAANASEFIFIIGFLKLRNFFPRWYKVSNALKWVFLTISVGSIFEYWFTGKLNYATGLTGFFGVLGLPVLILMPFYLSYKGYKPAQYFACATLSMVLFSFIFVVLVFGGFEWQEHLDLVVFVGIANQAVFFSIALGYKLRVESDNLNAKLAMHVEHLDKLVAEKTSKIRSILDNVNLGIFRINREMKIDSEYSKACDEIFPGTQLGGADAVEVVFNASRDFGKEQASLFQTVLDFSLGHDMLNYDCNAHALPKEIAMKSGKYLEMDWTPISDDDGNLGALLVSAKDVTYVRELEISRQRSLEEVHNLMNIIKHGPAKMENYIETERVLLQKTITALPGISGNHGNRDSLGLIMRNVHTIKGNARSFGLDNISNVAHECESQCLSKEFIADDYSAIHSYLLEIDRAFHELQAIIDKYVNSGKLEARDHQDQVIGYLSMLDQMVGQGDSRLSPDLLQLKTFLKKMTGVSLEELLAPMMGDLDRICGVLGKRVPEVLIHDNGLFIRNDHLSEVRSVLNHIIKNSLDHGLEKGEERLKAGKSGHGKIVISLAQAQGGAENPSSLDSLPFILEFHDDGRGLDVGKILKKALAAKYSPPERLQTVRDAATVIFRTGFTSKDDVTDISGRGVGMDAIKEFTNEIGGTVDIEFFDKGIETRSPGPNEVLFVPFKLVVKLPANTCI